MTKLSNVRTGRATSSDIVALVSNGKGAGPEPGVPFFTYIEECRAERFFKQTLENDVDVFAMQWGKLCEGIVHNMLGLEYQFQSDQTEIHPKIPAWVGTPDGKIMKEVLRKWTVDTITDIKCPFTRKAFYKLIEELYDFDGVNASKKKTIDGDKVILMIRNGNPTEKKYYWQLVSNACILDAKNAELIIFMPYYEQLDEIKLHNTKLPADQMSFKVANAKEDELPYIYKESGVENLNIIRFKVPVEDKKFLEKRVKMAVAMMDMTKAMYDEMRSRKDLKTDEQYIVFIKEKTKIVIAA